MNDQLTLAPAPDTTVRARNQRGRADVRSPRPVCLPPQIAAIAKDGPQANRFALLLERRFVPAGRIRAAFATGSQQFLDAFVQPIGDSLIGPDHHGRISIIDALAQSAAMLGHWDAVGIDFSALRAKGSRVAGTRGCRAAGPAAYLRLFEQLHDTVCGADTGRGLVTATLRIDHPDMLRFVASPLTSGARRCVALTDAFMHALRDDSDFNFMFDSGPEPAPPSAVVLSGGTCLVEPGELRPVAARELWQAILRRCSDKVLGLAFIDSVHGPRSVGDAGHPATPVLPAGPLLPPYGAIARGNLTLPAFVATDDAGGARFDWDGFRVAVAEAVEFLDRVLDVTLCPLPQQLVELRNTRPIGLACRGLTDTLAKLALRPGSEEGIAFAHRLWTTQRDTAFLASIELARASGAFPLFDADRYLATGSFGSTLPPLLQLAIRQNGIRNSRLLSAWLPDDRGRKGMNIDERLHTLATVAPLVDGGTALPLRIPRDCTVQAAAGIVSRAWEAGATEIVLHC